jgi:hypothetical protein
LSIIVAISSVEQKVKSFNSCSTSESLTLIKNW